MMKEEAGERMRETKEDGERGSDGMSGTVQRQSTTKASQTKR